MEYQRFTLPDSGETVLIRKVSPFVGQELRRTFQPPTPPVQKVNYGTTEAPQWEEEENPADPDYQRAVAEYYQELERKLMRLNVKLGVQVEWDETKRARLEELRAVLAEEGLSLDENETLAYVRHVAVATLQDYQALTDEITGRSQPREEAIQGYVDMFRPDVQGTGLVPREATQEWDQLLAATGMDTGRSLVGLALRLFGTRWLQPARDG